MNTRDDYRIRLLYHCGEYYCEYGARTHAREFFSAIQTLPEVGYAEVYPHRPENGAQRATMIRSRNKLGFLPRQYQILIRMLRSHGRTAKDIKNAIEHKQLNVVVTRTSGNRFIPCLKAMIPNVILCVELNAMAFAEVGQNIPFRRFWDSIEVKTLDAADCITVVSSSQKKELTTAGVAGDKVLINPNGVNPGVFRCDVNYDRLTIMREFTIPSGAYVLGYVGGMEGFRRIPEVVEQFAALRRGGEEDLFLVLIGDGEDMGRVQAKIVQHYDVLKGWVWCGGRRPYHRLPAIMRCFDLAINPFLATGHGSPQKLFEYLAMGLPTIGPSVPHVREVFRDGEHLLLATQENGDFARKVKLLRHSRELCARIAQAGREYVLANFTWRHNAQRVVDFIKDYQAHAGVPK